MTVLRLKATAETRKVLSNKMAKPPWVHGRGLDTFYPIRACNSSKGRRMVNAWTKETLEHLLESTCCSTSSLTAAKSGIVMFFFAVCIVIELLLGGGSFIVLRSRGISQICHTYSEDMHPIYPPLPWLHTPRLRLGVTTS